MNNASPVSSNGSRRFCGIPHTSRSADQDECCPRSCFATESRVRTKLPQPNSKLNGSEQKLKNTADTFSNTDTAQVQTPVSSSSSLIPTPTTSSLISLSKNRLTSSQSENGVTVSQSSAHNRYATTSAKSNNAGQICSGNSVNGTRNENSEISLVSCYSQKTSPKISCFKNNHSNFQNHNQVNQSYSLIETVEKPVKINLKTKLKQKKYENDLPNVLLNHLIANPNERKSQNAAENVPAGTVWCKVGQLPLKDLAETLPVATESFTATTTTLTPVANSSLHSDKLNTTQSVSTNNSNKKSNSKKNISYNYEFEGHTKNHDDHSIKKILYLKKIDTENTQNYGKDLHKNKLLLIASSSNSNNDQQLSDDGEGSKCKIVKNRIRLLDGKNLKCINRIKRSDSYGQEHQLLLPNNQSILSEYEHKTTAYRSKTSTLTSEDNKCGKNLKEQKFQISNQLDTIISCERSVRERISQSSGTIIRDFPRPYFLNKFVKNSDSYDLQKDSDFKFNAFGYRKPLEEYSRYTEERKARMDKKRTAMDRFHKLGFGKRSGSSETKPSKAEKLRELTELLKGTSSRNSSNNNTTTTIPQPPPLPPKPLLAPQVPFRYKKRSRTLFDFNHSIDSDTDQGLLAIDTKSLSDTTQTPLPTQSRTTSPTSTSSINYKPPLRPNVSASNLSELDSEQSKFSPDASRSTNCLLNEDIFPKLLRPESRQIIGSYTQSTIPFRSASFSQADHMTHKYGFATTGNRVDKATDTNRYPEKSEISVNLKENGLIAGESTVDLVLEVAEEAQTEMEEKIDPMTTIEDSLSKIKILQAAEMVLDPLAEEEACLTTTPLTDDLQKATTCVIPIPACGAIVNEWSTTSPSEEWVQNSQSVIESNRDLPFDESLKECESKRNDKTKNESEVDKESDKEVSMTKSQDKRDSKVFSQSSLDETESLVEDELIEQQLNISEDSEKLTSLKNSAPIAKTESSERAESITTEVRKRHSNNDVDPANVSSTNIGSEEKRRIDKSKRRKGIYIQWPVLERSQDTDSPDSSTGVNAIKDWRNDIVEHEGYDTHFAHLTSHKIEDRLSFSSTDLTPIDTPLKPVFPNIYPSSTLITQASEDRDDANNTSSPPRRNLQNLFIRGDSVFDSDTEKNYSHDRSSTSPAPVDGDLKRYSKRPLRGPYGQMLEAEMKKLSPKVQYERLLGDITKPESHVSSVRNRSHSSMSFDETNIPTTVSDATTPTNNKSNTPTQQKNSSDNSSSLVPTPSHARTASSPAQLLDVTAYSSKLRSDFLDVQPHKPFSSIDSPKRTSSDTSDKYSKRSLSNASDKSQRRGTDDGRSSRTPSERSFILHTPDTPKGVSATPELLAELLKGSSEKLAIERAAATVASQNQSPLCHDSNLPLQLNIVDADPRIHIVFELYNTEKSYVESLQTVITKYLNPLKEPENAGIIDATVVDEIFFMIPSIFSIHKRFLDELERRFNTWETNQKVGDAFTEIFESPSVLETYTLYMDNWNKSKKAIQTLMVQRPQFAKFLESMARIHERKLSLDHLLIKPVQKFPHYELIFNRLIRNTDVDHPDYKPLQDAEKLVHEILTSINSIEQEALENGKREATLREIESVIEGVNDLVSPERSFLLFDLVTMPSGQATRKERGFFLFSDLLVITSIKRRGGTTRKPITNQGSVACTLDTNKYKYITKIALDDLEIVKSKDDNIKKIMREIEQLSEDCSKLQQISELAISLKCPHQLLEEAIRELQRDLQRQLSERQSNDSQLSMLEFTLSTSNGVQNMSVVFSKPEKRTQWEETITEAKQKLAANFDKYPTPEFITSVPIRKTRAGLQFTCASPTLSFPKDVWVCNSDGYVGQVCVLSLGPEPTVTSCNGVCNARILCVASVPANIESKKLCISIEDTNVKNVNDSISTPDNINTIAINRTSNDDRLLINASDCIDHIPPHLDFSSSSDDSESENVTSTSGGNQVSPTLVDPMQQQFRNSDSYTVEESDCQQSTMWLGTEDGCIHVYNCTDNIRIKKNKIKIQHISAVHAILYLDNRVFVSLANGDILVYTRDHTGWNTSSPLSISVGTVTSPVTKLVNVHGKLWCAIQGIIKILNTSTLQVENQIQISSESKPVTNLTVLGNYVWISVQNTAYVKCFHSTSYDLVFDVNLAPTVNKMLSSCDDIIRQHKAACLRVTSLLACKDLIWVGTSAGVILTVAAQGIHSNSSIPAVSGIPYGHTGHVRFLTCAEVDPSTDANVLENNANRRISMHSKHKLEQSKLLVISGGDGYEDFRSSANNSLSEVAGREDSTNHLLLWEV